jgi:ATP-dependent Clp protease ATP-binding subunit ClpC
MTQNDYNFSDRAQRVLRTAKEEADRFNHEYIGTEHILLGLIREEEGVGAATLRNLNVPPEKVRQEIEGALQPGVRPPRTGSELPYTTRTKRVLELATAEATTRKHGVVDTEHLLLGLVGEGKGVGGQVLVYSCGVTYDKASAEIMRLRPA